MQKIKALISCTAWPVLLAASLTVAGYGLAGDHPVIVFNIVYLSLALTLFGLERFIPHECAWQAPDGQTFANIAHTLSSKGTVQVLLISGSIIGLSEMITPLTGEPYGLALWPRQWSMAFQVVMGVVVAEFVLYWCHRLGHEWLAIWRFHAVHHSVTRLWVVNTGRFHFMDSAIKVVASLSLLAALGTPMEVIQWLSAITAFIGILTHCNVEMRFGFLSLLFNTPELHRWHHSRDLREGNKNYGENVMIWDLLFGTYFREPHRRPSARIGIDEYMPESFWRQLVWPFLSRETRRRWKKARLNPA